MAGTVVTRFTGDSSDLERKEEKVRQGMAKVTEETKRLTAESRRMERVAKQAWESTLTPAEKYKQKINDLNLAFKTGKLDPVTYRKAVQQLTDQFGAAETTTKSFGSTLLSFGVKYVAPFLAIKEAIGAINHEIDEWEEKTKDITERLTKQNMEAIAFYSLQEKGTRAERARKAIALGEGIATPGEALDIVQRFQSATGSVDKAYKIAQDLYDAVRAGVPLQEAKELATQAAVRKEDPQYWLRAAFAAGEASGRSAVEVTRAGEALSYFEDRDLGFRIAALMAEFHPTNVREITTQVGKALSGTLVTEELVESWKKLGVDSIDPAVRMQALMKAGITTPQKLSEFGFRDLALTGLTDLTKALKDGHFEELSKGFRERVQQEDIIVRRRREIEQEVPEVGITRAIEETKSRTEQRQLDKEKAAASREQLFQSTLVDILQQRGLEEIGWFDLFDPTTRKLNLRQFHAMKNVFPSVQQAYDDASKETNRILREIEGATRRTPPVVPLPENN